MRKNTSFEEIDERSKVLIKHKARQLVGHYGFVISDVEDIEQELTLYLMQTLPKYNRSRAARTTFIESVLNNKIRRIIEEERQSGSYDHRLIGRSLDEPIATDCGFKLLLSDMVESDSRRICNGDRTRTESDKADLRIDLDRAVREMTPEMRAICAGLAVGGIKDVAEKIGMPRHKILWLRLRIRRILSKYGLDEYF